MLCNTMDEEVVEELCLVLDNMLAESLRQIYDDLHTGSLFSHQFLRMHAILMTEDMHEERVHSAEAFGNVVVSCETYYYNAKGTNQMKIAQIQA
ncbi:hypothetical protein GUJ93_ZPchr0002g24299 [Zizania palustris]|uniref:Uncharacterized protein n=1 Tax=Zizania palustris TaxID=103762 RepID=A0A8J5RTN8_ZIZPA|nr:hypothetical protein GUJ93_ZPchr0002g24299 [Zizania palustris]